MDALFPPERLRRAGSPCGSLVFSPTTFERSAESWNKKLGERWEVSFSSAAFHCTAPPLTTSRIPSKDMARNKIEYKLATAEQTAGVANPASENASTGVPAA